MTKMKWSRPKRNGHDQNEMVMTKMNWSGPNCDEAKLSLWNKPDYHLTLVSTKINSLKKQN
jgi:hypothetical protein